MSESIPLVGEGRVTLALGAVQKSAEEWHFVPACDMLRSILLLAGGPLEPIHSCSLGQNRPLLGTAGELYPI